jgi:tetratricopeptide (TPR) repeat protein
MDEQEIIREQLEKNPNDADLWYLLGNTLPFDQPYSEHRPQYTEKKECYEKAIKLNPFHLDARFALAQLEEQNDWWHGAKYHYEYIKKRNPSYPRIDEYLKAGEEKETENNKRQLTYALERLKERPNHPNSLRLVASCYTDLKDHATALEWYKKAYEIAPDDYNVNAFLSFCYRSNKMFKEAIEFAQRRLNMEDDEEEQGRILKYIGSYHNELQEYSKARECFEQCLVKFHNEPSWQADVHYKIGITYAKEREFKKSLYHYREALSLAENEHAKQELHRRIGEMLCNLEQFEEAIEYLQRAATMRKDDELAFFALGFAYSHLDEPDLAETAYRMTLNVNPENERALVNLGLLCHKREDFADAIPLYEKVLSVNQESLYAYANLARIYARLQEDELAEYYLDLYLKHGGKSEDL